MAVRKRGLDLGMRLGIALILYCITAIALAAPPIVSTVPVDPNDPILPHDVISGQPTTLKGAVDVGSVGATWTWDPGDGSPSVSGTVDPLPTSFFQTDDVGFTPPHAIWIEHTYIGQDGDIILATLTVDNGIDAPVSAVYRTEIRDKTLPVEVNAAIDEALWFMHRNQFRFDGRATQGNGSTTAGAIPMTRWNFPQTGGTAQNSSTSAVINAFEANGYLETGPASSPYTETVARGLKYAIASLATRAIGPQTFGRPAGLPDDPDANGNGIGVYVNGTQPNYQGGMVMDAIIASGTPDAVAVTGPANVVGRTYGEIIQDMVDYYAWGQGDNFSRSGWHYSPWNNTTGNIDNSVSGWAAIGLLAAEEVFGATVPQWVKDRNPGGLELTDTESDTSNNDGRHGYTNSPNPVWGPFGVTGAAMVQMAMDDIEATTSTTPDERWVRTENYFRRHFGQPIAGNNFRNYYYAMFNFAKAMRTAVPSEVVIIGDNNSVGCGPNGGTTGCGPALAPLDWYSDPAIGLARTVVDFQTTTGVNIGMFTDRPGNSQGSNQDEHNTSWATQILTRTLFQAGPVARAAANPNPGAADVPIGFDASASFHQDPARSLVNYQWDFDNDGTFDASGVFATHNFPCATLPIPCSFPVTLRVTDDNVPARFDDDIVLIEITVPPRPPTAVAGGPYLVCANEDFQADGSDSFDVDEGTSESGAPPFDTITGYEWELDGVSPFDFGEASGATPTISFPVPGERDIGLRVSDNTALAFPIAQSPNLTNTDFTRVDVADCGCMGPIKVRSKPGKNQLVWSPVPGAASYDIYRSTDGAARGLSILRSNVVTSYATFLDKGLTNGQTYWYRVTPLDADGMAICDSSLAAFGTPQTSRRARASLATVPDVTNITASEAANALADELLTLGQTSLVPSDAVPEGLVISQNPPAGSRVREGSIVNIVVSTGPVRIEAPDVIGQTQADAEAAIIGAGLAIGTVTTQNSNAVPAGNVIGQDPIGGLLVTLGSAIDLVVSLGPQTTAVPDVLGQTQADAEAAIIAAALTVGTVGTQNSNTVPAGAVIGQSPVGGTVVVLGTPVDIVISLGPVTFPAPNVIGQSQADAEAAIVSAGFVVGTITEQLSSTVPQGTVINQSPGAGSLLLSGATISLVVSLGPPQVTVPDVVGLQQLQAEAAISAAELAVGVITTQNSLVVPAGEVISQDPAGGTTVNSASPVNLVVSLGPVQVSVPDVVGQSQANAQAAITAANLTVGAVTQQNSLTVPAGDVISQNPAGGTTVDEQSAVSFVVSLGPVQVSVPNIVGLAQATAEAAITGASLTVGAITQQNNPTVPAGDVISQNPIGGTTVDEQSAVSFVVSLGPVQVSVPDVVGMTQATAEAAIVGANLTVGTVTTINSDTIPAGEVISQNPVGGTTVDEGSAVNLTVSLGAPDIAVPNVVGLSQANASANILGAGLTVGTVSTSNSSTVPAGDVISQDPVAGVLAASNSAVNIVVSLGPVQVPVPGVVGLTQVAAEAAITGAGLTVGTVSTASSDTVPAGDVISQNPVAGTIVSEGSGVDMEVSTGPAAGLSVTLALSTSAITAGDPITLIPEVIDGDGVPMTPMPPVTYSITFAAGEASGTLPTESGGVILTSADTRGVYTVTVTVDGDTATASADFLIYRPAATSGQKALYGGLSTSMNGIAASAEALAESLATGDIAGVQSALDAMRSARNAVNRTAMRRSTVFAPEGGFLPTTAQLAANGYPQTADDATLQIVLNNIVVKLQETSAFYASLNATGPIDDEARMNQLNAELQALLDQLNALNPSPNGWVEAAGLVNYLYAVVFPQHLYAVVDRFEAELVGSGIGVADAQTPADFYRQLADPQQLMAGQPMVPGAYYANRQPAFFSLAGMSVAVQIQMRIVTDVYGPILHDLARVAAILAIDGLLNQFVNNMNLPGIITGASLSFHVFNAGGSVIEVNGANRTLPERSDVFLVGSAAIAAVEGVFSALDPSSIEDLDDVWEFFEGVVDAMEAAGEAAETANQLPSSVFPSCILSSSSTCVELVYPAGFNSVITCSGFVCFPQPVLILVHNLDTGTWAFDLFNFTP